MIGGIRFLRADALPWLIAQLSVVQFYNPDFLRGYGVGVLNGSLWTIPVELQFYLLLPAIYTVLNLRARRGNGGLAWLAAVSIAFQYAVEHFGGADSRQFLVKLSAVTVAPYLWMFLAGVVIQRNFERLERWLVGRGLLWVIAYAGIVMIGRPLGMTTGTGAPNPFAMGVLACAVIACAYSAPRLSHRVLRGNDASYGVYIYHMVVVNALVELAVPGTVTTVLGVVVATCGLAWVSWTFVERPALRRKRNSLHPLGDDRSMSTRIADTATAGS
jgi:peptidoglycan/LPS O-acetylase OafA/YrhL